MLNQMRREYAVKGSRGKTVCNLGCIALHCLEASALGRRNEVGGTVEPGRIETALLGVIEEVALSEADVKYSTPRRKLINVEFRKLSSVSRTRRKGTRIRPYLDFIDFSQQDSLSWFLRLSGFCRGQTALEHSARASRRPCRACPSSAATVSESRPLAKAVLG